MNIWGSLLIEYDDFDYLGKNNALTFESGFQTPTSKFQTSKEEYTSISKIC